MIESMKMELEVKATADGPVSFCKSWFCNYCGSSAWRIGGGAPIAAPVQEAAPVQASPVAAAPSGGTVIPAPVAGTYLKATVLTMVHK